MCACVCAHTRARACVGARFETQRYNLCCLARNTHIRRSTETKFRTGNSWTHLHYSPSLPLSRLRHYLTLQQRCLHENTDPAAIHCMQKEKKKELYIYIYIYIHTLFLKLLQERLVGCHAAFERPFCVRRTSLISTAASTNAINLSPVECPVHDYMACECPSEYEAFKGTLHHQIHKTAGFACLKCQ